jgi:prepilin-type processing-associated H-X9-DG protein
MNEAKKPRILHCPELGNTNKNDWRWRHYAMNAELTGWRDGTSTWARQPGKYSAPLQASQTLLITERADKSEVNANQWLPMLAFVSASGNATLLGERHNGAGNVLYFDGHVSPVHEPMKNLWHVAQGGYLYDNKYRPLWLGKH